MTSPESSKREQVPEFTSTAPTALEKFSWGCVLLLGGFLAVSTMLIVNANLFAPYSLTIFLTGCTSGMILMIAGTIGMGEFKALTGLKSWW